MSEFTIRMGTKADAQLISYQRHRMFADAGRGDEVALAEMDKHFPQWLERHLDDDTYLAWFACEGDKVVAGAGIWLMDWGPGMTGRYDYLPYLLNVYTEPDYRGRGLARLLVNATIDYCKAEGYSRLRLHASIYGRPLYEQLGFVGNNEMQLLF